MGNNTEITDLDEPWEEGAEESHAEENRREVGHAPAKAKPTDNKDARRRLDDILESQRIKHQIEDDF